MNKQDIRAELQYLIFQKLKKAGITDIRSDHGRQAVIKITRSAMSELKCDEADWQEFLNDMFNKEK